MISCFPPSRPSASAYTPYLTNSTINGRIAQQLNGSTIVLEHRFFGSSNPYGDLSIQSLRVHTVQQAVEDLAYFAQNVQLPMPGGDQVAPGKAPWILIGGSYAGALTSYAMNKYVPLRSAQWPLLNSGVAASPTSSMRDTHLLLSFKPLCTFSRTRRESSPDG